MNPYSITYISTANYENQVPIQEIVRQDDNWLDDLRTCPHDTNYLLSIKEKETGLCDNCQRFTPKAVDTVEPHQVTIVTPTAPTEAEIYGELIAEELEPGPVRLTIKPELLYPYPPANNFLKMPNLPVLQLSKLTDSAFDVYRYMRQFSSGQCYARVDTIAEDLGLSESTVKRATKLLVNTKLISKTRRRPERKSSIHRILDSADWDFYMFPKSMLSMGLDTREIRVWCYLAQCRNLGDGRIHPSTAEIAKACKARKKYVLNALDALEAKGLISRSQRPRNKKGFNMSDSYELFCPTTVSASVPV